MSPTKYMTRFGGACRTKHTLRQPITVGGWLRLAWSIARGDLDESKRLFPVRERSKLPPETIRLDPWEAEYLFTVAALAKLGIVEIGRFRGGSTFLLACANARVPIWSIDVKPLADDVLQSWFAQFDVGENVRLLVGDSRRDSFPEIGAFDVLFVDGGHSYAAARSDLETFYPCLAPGGHILLHDSYGGHPVQRAVHDFIADTDAGIIRSPYIPAAHWQTEHGSIAHLLKPLMRRAGQGAPRLDELGRQKAITF